MWDFPQVTMVFGSVGWNSTARTTSLVVYKKKNTDQLETSNQCELDGELTDWLTLISAIFDFFCQSQTVNMWSLQSSITLRC